MCRMVKELNMTQLIISKSLKIRKAEFEKILEKVDLKPQHPDVFYIEDGDKLGTDQAKKIREFLSFKPYQSRYRVVVIESADDLSIDAQNSLLKTLEEPLGESIIILGAKHEDGMIETVRSRATVLQLEGGEIRVDEKILKEIKALVGKSFEERFAYIEKLEKKEEFLDGLEIYFRELLRLENLEFIKMIIEAKRWKEANVNMRAILEYLMLNMPRS